jgi:hypothetical protein
MASAYVPQRIRQAKAAASDGDQRLAPPVAVRVICLGHMRHSIRAVPPSAVPTLGVSSMQHAVDVRPGTVLAWSRAAGVRIARLADRVPTRTAGCTSTTWYQQNRQPQCRISRTGYELGRPGKRLALQRRHERLRTAHLRRFDGQRLASSDGLHHVIYRATQTPPDPGGQIVLGAVNADVGQTLPSTAGGWWAALRPRTETLADARPPNEFVVDVTLTGPTVTGSRLSNTFKALLDGLISCFHAHDGSRHSDLYGRLTDLGEPVNVWQQLTNASTAGPSRAAALIGVIMLWLVGRVGCGGGTSGLGLGGVVATRSSAGGARRCVAGERDWPGTATQAVCPASDDCGALDGQQDGCSRREAPLTPRTLGRRFSSSTAFRYLWTTSGDVWVVRLRA